MSALRFAIQRLLAPILICPQTHQNVSRIPEVRHHHQKNEERCDALNHANLQVREENEFGVHQLILLRVAGRAFHYVCFGSFVGVADGGKHVRAQVDQQNENGFQWERDLEHNERQKRADFWNVGRQRVRNGFLQIVEDQTSFFNSVHNRREVVVHQNHVRRLLAHRRSHDAHRDTDVRLTQRRCVVHAVARHRYDLAALLRLFHDHQLLLWRRAREHHLRVVQNVVPECRGQVRCELPARHHDGRSQRRVLPARIALLQPLSVVA